ncbi:MAG: preprotein translocase subunit YajC [Clostridiales bacterium]|nr:preprotein translocase subunit YajC [Clostridiales bacterium]
MTLEIILVVILLVLLVALFVISTLKKKKFNQDLTQMRQELKIGDKVMTDSGVVGEVVDSYEEEGYKYFVLKSGRGENAGYFTVHGNAIYYVFGKEAKTNEKVVVKVTPKSEDNQ